MIIKQKQFSLNNFIKEDKEFIEKLRKDSIITLDFVDNETKRFNFNKIITTYHTYKPTAKTVGRRVDYIIRANNYIIGAIGLGCPVIAMADRDNFIGWNEKQRLANLTKIGSNWRFCLKDKGFGSRVLSVFCKEARKDYKRIYGDNLMLIETLIEPPYEGTCYKANGWVVVGKTKGFSFEALKSFDTKELAKQYKIDKGIKTAVTRSFKDGKTLLLRPIKSTPKIILVKPLHRYWKKELLRMPKENVITV